MDQLQRVWNRASRMVLGEDYTRPDGLSRSAPEWLILVINNFCNLHCKMCDVGLGESNTVFYEHLIGSDPHNMTVESLNQILAQASHFSPRPKIGLAYTEPLIHRQVLDFCQAIVEQGFVCSITSNGFMLPRLARHLVEIEVQEIVISVDGPEAVHDHIRGKKGSFRNLYDGVAKINEAKVALGKSLPIVRFSYTLTDENCSHLMAFMAEVEGLHPAGINFSHLNFINDDIATLHNAQYNGEWAVSRSNLGAMELNTFDLPALWQSLQEVKAYAQHRPQGPAITIVPDFTSPAGLDTFYNQATTFVGGRVCTDPWRMIMIRTDGSVIPAYGRRFNFVIGNVGDTP